MRNPSLLLHKFFVLTLFLLCAPTVLSSYTAATKCPIKNCVECITNETSTLIICQKCENTYVMNDQQTTCQQREESSNTGLIVGISLGSAVFLCLGYCIWRKCRTQSKDREKSSSDAVTGTFSPAFSATCLGINFGEPLDCIQFRSSTNCMLGFSDQQQQDQCGYVVNRFNQKCSVDSPFKNDCDRFAFKLDRKQNLFPEWAVQPFERYTPTNPSSRAKLFTARFATTFERIPEDVLEQSEANLAALLSSPVLEPIQFKEKQTSKSSYSDQDDTTSATSKSTNTTISNEPSTSSDTSPSTLPQDSIFTTMTKTTATSLTHKITQSSPQIQYQNSNENYLQRNRSESNSDLLPKLSLNNSPQTTALSIPQTDPDQNPTLALISIPDSSRYHFKENTDSPSPKSNDNKLLVKAEITKVSHVIVPMPTDPCSDDEFEG